MQQIITIISMLLVRISIRLRLRLETMRQRETNLQFIQIKVCRSIKEISKKLQQNKL